jgi:MFS family permease
MRVLGPGRRLRAGPHTKSRIVDTGIHGRRPLLSLLAANAVSQMGNMMVQAVAIPWFVLETTGSATRTGLTAAAIAVGAVVPSALGGPLVDRVGFKRSSMVADLASAATIAAIPVLHLADMLAFWHLLLLAFLMAALNAQGDTARLALLPTLADSAGMAVERANAADRAIARFGQLAGPAIAGILVVLIGASNVLFVDAATFTVSALLVAVGVPREPGRGDRGNKYLSDLVEGFMALRANKPVMSMAYLATVGNFLDVPLVTVVLPVYAMALYGSAASLGFVVGAFAAGAIIGAILFGILKRHPPRRIMFLLSFGVAAILVYGTLVSKPPLGILVAAAGIGGIVAGPINPLFLTVIQETTPTRLLGRVSGAINGLVQAAIPFGAALAGIAIEGFGLIETVLVMGSVYLTVIVVMSFNQALRRIDKKGIA